jgi:hypothetical protein
VPLIRTVSVSAPANVAGLEMPARRAVFNIRRRTSSEDKTGSRAPPPARYNPLSNGVHGCMNNPPGIPDNSLICAGIPPVRLNRQRNNGYRVSRIVMPHMRTSANDSTHCDRQNPAQRFGALERYGVWPYNISPFVLPVWNSPLERAICFPYEPRKIDVY